MHNYSVVAHSTLKFLVLTSIHFRTSISEKKKRSSKTAYILHPKALMTYLLNATVFPAEFDDEKEEISKI